MTRTTNFDPIARPYRWLEYLTLGSTLQRTRLHFLPTLTQQRSALVIGDGDGRFLSHLLARNPDLQATAVDSSATMLHLLRQRCAPFSNRLQTLYTDALALTPPPNSYDVVVTHFFLDCLPQPDLHQLIANLAPAPTPGALWLLSDFRIPNGLLHIPARILVRTLYLAFRILTGLRTTRLPDYSTPLTQAGLTRIAQHHFLAGILTTELWQRTTSPRPISASQTK